MWERESELTDFIKKKLEEKGYQVTNEVTLHRFRIDLIAERKVAKKVVERGQTFVPRGSKKIVKGIEVKLDHHKIYDAISRCAKLSRLPELDEVYVAFPKFYDRKDIRDVLSQVPVGVILANEEKIETMPPPWNINPAALSPPTINGKHKVCPDQVFKIEVGTCNVGAKFASNVKLRWKPAGPFRRPRGENNTKRNPKLEPGQWFHASFKVKVKPKTSPGKYILIAKVSADDLEVKASVVEILVETLPETSSKIVYSPKSRRSQVAS